MDKFTEAYKKVLQKYKNKDQIKEDGGACAAPAGGPAPCAGGPGPGGMPPPPPCPATVANPPNPCPPPHPPRAGIHTRNVGALYVPFVIPGALYGRNGAKKKKRRVKRRKKK